MSTNGYGRFPHPCPLPEGAPARSVPAGIGGKAAQSGETGDADSLRELYTNSRGITLLAMARAAIANALGKAAIADESAVWLDEPGACFVTLTIDGQLRGCIGSLEAHRSLRDDLKANAKAAAFHDPRFPPLGADELDQIRVEVSLLSPQQALRFSSEADALSLLRPLEDGVVFEYGHHRSTFLPQVWEQLPEPAEFMAHLKAKAGLPPGFWAEGVKLSRYRVEKWEE